MMWRHRDSNPHYLMATTDLISYSDQTSFSVPLFHYPTNPPFSLSGFPVILPQNPSLFLKPNPFSLSSTISIYTLVFFSHKVFWKRERHTFHNTTQHRRESVIINHSFHTYTATIVLSSASNLNTFYPFPFTGNHLLSLFHSFTQPQMDKMIALYKLESRGIV